MNNVSRRIAANNGMQNIMDYNIDGSKENFDASNCFQRLPATEAASNSMTLAQQRFNNIAEGLLYNNRRDTSLYPTNISPQSLLTPIQPYYYPNTQNAEQNLIGIKSHQLEALATPQGFATSAATQPSSQSQINQYSETQLPLINPTAQQTENAPAIMQIADTTPILADAAKNVATQQGLATSVATAIGLAQSDASIPRQKIETFSTSSDTVIQTRIIIACTIVFMFTIFMIVQLYLSHKRIQLLLSLYNPNSRSPNDLDFIIKDIF